MHSQSLISVLVFWVAAFCFSPVVSNDTIQSQKLDLANKLNTLVRHSGWRTMDYVKITKHRNHSSLIEDPMSVILEAVSSERNPVDQFNVQERYDEIFTVLKCKYVEVIYKFKSLVQHFIRVCRNVKTKSAGKPTKYTFQKYYDCFRLLLIKLHSISPRFKCMKDALEFIESLGLQQKPKSCITVAAEKLTEYTLTVGPRTSDRFSQQGFDEEVIDVEIKTISDYFINVTKHLNGFSHYYCNLPSHSYWTMEILNEDFESKKRYKLIAEDTTMVQYVIDEMDCFVNDILGNCFFDLGFAHDLTGTVTIRNI